MATSGTAAKSDLQRAFTPRDASLRGMRNTLLLRLLVVALLPLVTLSWYMRHQFRTTLERNARALLLTVARGHRGDVDRFISNKIAVLRNLAETDLVSLPPSREQLRALLQVLQGLDGMILDIGVFDDQGNHIRYAGPFAALEGRNYRNETWFRTLAESAADTYVSDVYLGYRHEPHFIVALRTISNGRPWYLRVTINPERFTQMVNEVLVADGASAFVVNRENLFQAVPATVGRPLEHAALLPEMNEEEGVREVVQGETGYLIAYAKLRTMNWTLIVRQDLAAAYAPIQTTRRAVLAIIGVGVVFIVVASLYATQNLIRRYSRVERDRSRLVEQLVQTGKMSTLGEMAAGVAHEINNPLAVIVSETGLMEDSLNPAFGGRFNREEFLERLDTVKQEAYRCRDITHKLLGFARYHAPRIAECRLDALIEETVDLLRRELKLENIEIVIEADPQLPPVRTDGEKVRQVLLNLLKNAADAIGKGGRITIQAFAEGDRVGLIVSDTGKGIPEEHLGKIFEPFFTTKEVGKGTGLGLAISHGIITSLGGEINVTSQVGRGTSFEILLPRRGPEAAPAPARR